ncbi:hypothetical protein NDU88_008177 [Pleurodeles waltl]|uniref:Uncharacterized protein n=1 Tax=Pleurodeles waltl TaxID=8319 RepID=A0AAV7VWI8_PLEWA|nr:hypothetical protein NDU88_008177 [Pleurodeles waltl]
MQATPPGDQADKLDIILQEIRDSRQAIEKKLGSITIELNILKDDQKKLSDRLKQAESNVAEILPTHNENKNAIERLQQQIVKKRLRTEGLKYALLFPARLRVTFNQKTHFFDTPDSACDWLDVTFPHLGSEERDALPPRQPHQSRRSGRGAPMSLTVESCLLVLLPRLKKEKALPRLTNLALILAKRLLTKRWKATAPPTGVTVVCSDARLGKGRKYSS